MTAEAAKETGAPGDPGPAAEKRRIVDLLETEWRDLADLLAGLSPESWALPALPGWDVHDVVGHIVGTELMLEGAEAPEAPDHVVGAPHVSNAIGRANEAWVEQLRSRSDAELLDELVAVTGRRIAALREMAVEDFAAPSWTPVGQATYGRFMAVRIFDSWMHEQDVRHAVGRPGNEGGPAAEQSLGEVVGALGYIVGKRAGVPRGTSVRFELTGPVVRTIDVLVADRAAVVDSLPGPPTTTLRCSSSLFLRLAGGRIPADELPGAIDAGVVFEGDPAIGRQVATHLAYTI